MNSYDTVLNYARARRLANRYCYGVKVQIERIEEAAKAASAPANKLSYDHYTLKNDWEYLAVCLIRLRRCLCLVSQLEPEVRMDRDYIVRFDNLLSDLIALRNFEEHLDEYSLGRGRNRSADWGHLETFLYGAEKFSNGVGSLDVESARAAMRVAWEAVLSVESDARSDGFLTWDDRYGSDHRMECLNDEGDQGRDHRDRRPEL